MANYIGYRDGGKTNEQGLFQWLGKIFTKGSPTIDTSTSWQVVQRGAGANMSVDVSIGDGSIANSSGYNYYGWSDAANNVVVSASDPTNPRIDTAVAYIDLSVVSSASNNNPGALKFAVVTGTPAGSPAAPNNAAILAIIGGSNAYIVLANIAVAASATQVVNANITDTRAAIALKAKLWGGGSNTVGHTVPNVADDTVALLNATQTFTNKTFTSPILSTPAISSWDGWQALTNTPNTVTALGNRSYSVVYNSVDLTSVISPGMRMKFTRTAAAPTKCTSLNGSTQYYSKSSPNKQTFTDDFVVSAWVKLSSYAFGSIASHYNGTSGWDFRVDSTGHLELFGFNANAANYSEVFSLQALPLNRWVHIAAQLDMSGFTASPTTSYAMVDGLDVPASVARAGTNPTALVQAGNLEIGGRNAGTQPFPGKIAQVAIYNAKVTQATILASMNQTIVGNETSLASAYSFNNSIADLNTTTPNDLTANGSAVATNTDSPFAQAATAGTIEYGIVTATSFSTNTTLTVQIPEGSALPTSGGINASSYSAVAAPLNFPALSKFKLSAYDTSGTLTNPLLAVMVSYIIVNPLDALPFTNVGSAGGAFYLSQTGSARILEGLTTTFSIVGSGAVASAAQAVTLPAGFFTTIQTIVTSIGSVPSGTSSLYATLQALTGVSSLSVIMNQTLGANGSAQISLSVKGT